MPSFRPKLLQVCVGPSLAPRFTPALSSMSRGIRVHRDQPHPGSCCHLIPPAYTSITTPFPTGLMHVYATAPQPHDGTYPLASAPLSIAHPANSATVSDCAFVAPFSGEERAGSRQNAEAVFPENSSLILANCTSCCSSASSRWETV